LLILQSANLVHWNATMRISSTRSSTPARRTPPFSLARTQPLWC